MRKKNLSSAETATTPADSPVKDSLSPDHLLQLEVFSRDIEILRHLRVIKELELKLKTQEQRLLQFELEELQRQLAQAALSHENKKKSRTALVSTIKDVYGISDSFGYNPETGAVVRT